MMSILTTRHLRPAILRPHALDQESKSSYDSSEDEQFDAGFDDSGCKRTPPNTPHSDESGELANRHSTVEPNDAGSLAGSGENLVLLEMNSIQSPSPGECNQ